MSKRTYVFICQCDRLGVCLCCHSWDYPLEHPIHSIAHSYFNRVPCSLHLCVHTEPGHCICREPVPTNCTRIRSSPCEWGSHRLQFNISQYSMPINSSDCIDIARTDCIRFITSACWRFKFHSSGVNSTVLGRSFNTYFVLRYHFINFRYTHSARWQVRSATYSVNTLKMSGRPPVERLMVSGALKTSRFCFWSANSRALFFLHVGHAAIVVICTHFP